MKSQIVGERRCQRESGAEGTCSVSISKKANFLSGIEQIDALKRDRVWAAGKTESNICRVSE
jgi:hypothetical protein